MDNKIIDLVDKVLDYFNRNGFDISCIKKDDLISYVLSTKNKFNPDRGRFESYFGAITYRHILFFIKKNKVIIERNNKIESLITKDSRKLNIKYNNLREELANT